MVTNHFFKNKKKKIPKSNFRIRKWTKINVQKSLFWVGLGSRNSLHLPTYVGRPFCSWPNFAPTWM
uniref:Uncharacterized protein n=1 Tax=viral metagenome TaxID=1070528 RepID=A0A6C0F4I2_9ZZZZ